jgi:hypothetical protein
MEERLEDADDNAGEADEGAAVNPAEASEPGVDDSDVPENEGESAEEAGQ